MMKINLTELSKMISASHTYVEIHMINLKRKIPFIECNLILKNITLYQETNSGEKIPHNNI